MEVSVVNSAGGSFCWNYDIFCGNYAVDNVFCIYAGFEVVLFVNGILVLDAVRRFCSTYASQSFCSKYVGDNFCL